MKKLIYFLSIALIFAAACSEEEDTFQNQENQDTVKNKPESNTKILTGKQDVLDTNTFSVFQSGSKRITDLDCYIEISSQFEILDLNGKNISAVGCVYSSKEKSPVIDGSNCETTNSNHTEIKSQSDKEITFKSGLHNLDFNTDYYVRSYVILEDENHNPCDTVYNQKVTKVHSTSLGDIWIQRNDASFSSRMNAISCTVSERVYLYGGKSGNTYFNDMWVYNKDNDTWSQKATFEDGKNTHYTGTERRSNGAAFAYIVYKQKEPNDTLLYILGGEIKEKKPTEKVIFYSTANDRYCDEKDHPNYGTREVYYYRRPKHDENGNIVYDDNGNPVMEEVLQQPEHRAYVEDLPTPMSGNIAFVVVSTIVPTYFVGFGKDDLGNFVSSFYQYNVNYDLENPDYPDRHYLSWQRAGDVLSYGGKTGEGLYQPVYEVCGSRIIVGTGESSKGGLSKSFYQISYNANARLIEVETTMSGIPENFAARANAASFYLKYTKNGEPHERFYVGTGRTYEEGSSGELLNDLWYYDFSQEKWGVARDFSNSTFCREGATGFATTRKDDFDKDISGILTEEARGIFTLGYGYPNESTAEKNYYKDSWEYLP